MLICVCLRTVNDKFLNKTFFKNVILKSVYNVKREFNNNNIDIMNKPYDFVNWPNKELWNHYKVLDAISSCTKTETNQSSPLNDELHFDPFLAPKDKFQTSVILAAKRYGVKAAIDIIEKYPKLTTFRDPYTKCDIPEKNLSLKDVVLSKNAKCAYNFYQQSIANGDSINDSDIFLMMEQACLYDKSGINKLSCSYKDSSQDDAGCYGDVILKNEGDKAPIAMMEGYFFGCYQNGDMTRCQKFFKDYLVYKNQLFSFYYYYYVLKEISSWFPSPEIKILNAKKILRIYQEYKTIPNSLVLNEILCIFQYDDEKFEQLLDEINNLNFPLSFKAYCTIHAHFDKNDDELCLHYMKRFVRELLTDEMFTLNQLNEDQEMGMDYMSKLSDELSNRNMWNYYMLFLMNISRLNAWDSFNSTFITTLIDNFLKIDTSMENFKKSLQFLSMTNIPSNVDSKNLDSYMRNCSHLDIDTFVQLNEYLKTIFSCFYQKSNLILHIDILTNILIRDHKIISISSAKNCITYLNGILNDRRISNSVRNRHNDVYLLLYLISHNYDAALLLMKRGTPAASLSSSTKAIHTAVYNILHTYSDYLIVQDIVMQYQRYYALYNIEQSRLALGKHRILKKPLSQTIISSNPPSNTHIES